MDFSAIVPALPGLWEGMQMTLQLMALGVLGGVVDAERECGGVLILGTVVAWGGVHAQLMPASLLWPRFQSACRRAPAGAPGSACRLVPPHRATGCAPPG